MFIPDPDFYPSRILDLGSKKLSISSQKYGLGFRDPRSRILDPGSGKNLSGILDPGVIKAPDPRSGSASLLKVINSVLRIRDVYPGS